MYLLNIKVVIFLLTSLLLGGSQNNLEAWIKFLKPCLTPPSKILDECEMNKKCFNFNFFFNQKNKRI